MTIANFLGGVATIVVGIVFWVCLLALIRGGWVLLKKSIMLPWRGAVALVKNPRQALVDAPVLVQLLILPFLLAFEWGYKRLYSRKAHQNGPPPQDSPQHDVAKEKQKLTQLDIERKIKEANAHITPQLCKLGQRQLYRERRQIFLIQVLESNIGDTLLQFKAKTVPTPGFSTPEMVPFTFGVNWDYFFSTPDAWIADYPCGRWRVDFDQARIERLCAYAKSLPADLLAWERYDRLNHYFIYGEDEQVRTVRRIAVDMALADLQKLIQQDELANWLHTLPAELNAECAIVCYYLYPDLETIKLEPHKPGYRIVIPFQWNRQVIDFTEENLLTWWKGVSSTGMRSPDKPLPTADRNPLQSSP